MNPPQARADQCDLEPPTGWARAKLGDIYELAYGKSLTKATRNKGGKYPVYGSNGIVGRHDTFLVEGPLLIVGRKGAAGAVSFSAKPCWPIDTTYYVCDSNHIDIRFSFHLFKSLRLNQFDRSTAIPGLNRYDVYDLQVWVPPLPEQRRIVTKIEELFSELDKGIENLKTARAKLKIYRQAVLKQAFEGKLTAQWHEKNKDKLETPEQLLARIKQERAARYEQQLEQWKAAVKRWEGKGKRGQKPRKQKIPATLSLPSEGEIENLPALPDDWLWIKVQALLAEPPANGHSVKNRPSGFPVLRLTAIKKERLDLSELKHGDWEREDALPYLVQEGDFLLARGNGSKHLVGRGGLVPTVDHDLAYPDTMIRLRVDPSAVDGSFFSYVWNSRLLRRQVENAARTTAGIYKINQGHVLSFVVPLCSLIEQSVVVDRLSAILAGIDKTEKEINENLGKASTLRQSILKKAFAGQLIAQNPSDEPASVLLDRIRAEREQITKRTTHRKTGKRKTARATA